ncbi:type VII secretion protein EccB [Streptomyces sp. MUM 178J]|uniref:type VII secretion protein EccB n=1 Tax=Streptomyces sp. MUM 178J TaxID=2791991 RepID=UPI001F035ABE|nr:type VII secretion protein EccB [Streptomyces sp. MUM 178J]WRQ81517.1 type VII secretion protein EccB [Streptomyces sp. MUM 178J]
MQSKRDQVQAHMFVMGRLTTAMLRGDPDAPESPQGRTNRGVAIGVVIAVLLSAGAFVLGLFKPGTQDSWKEPGTLVVNKDTGSRYLYLDGRLRPVRNYSSARLLAGVDMTVVSVGSRSLAGVPHGAPVGISGAPDALPAANGLDTGPWQVCSGTASGSVTTVLAVGAPADGAGLSTAQALAVTGPDKADYLIWRGSRLRLDDERGASRSLGYDATPRVKVSSAFLNSVPAGPDLSPPSVPGRGGKGPDLGGLDTRIGQVFQVTAPGSKARYYLLRREGLVPLTATGAALVLGDPDTRKKAYADGTPTARQLGADALDGHTAGSRTTDLADMPEAPPKAVELEPEQTACVRVQGGGTGTGTRVSVALSPRSGLGPAAQPAPEGLTPACVPVDRITVRAGGGALVHALGAGGGAVGKTVYLVTDSGMKYRIATEEGLAALGYGAGQARGLPSPLLAMLPTGPDLSPEAAVNGRGRTTAAACGSKVDSASSQGPTGKPDGPGTTGDFATPGEPTRKQ